MSEQADPLLTVAQVVERLARLHDIRIGSSTWTKYVSGGQAPPADDPDDEDRPVNRRRPRWLASTVDRYAKNRRGLAWAKGVPKVQAGQSRTRTPTD